MYLRAPLRLLSSSTFSAFLRISLLSIYNTKTICFRAINHSSMWVMLCLQAKLWRISIDQKFHFQSTNMRLPFIYNSYILFFISKKHVFKIPVNNFKTDDPNKDLYVKNNAQSRQNCKSHCHLHFSMRFRAFLCHFRT